VTEALAKRENAGGLARPASFAPQTFSEAMEFAKLVAVSDLAPKDYKDKPGNVLIAMQMGAELGLSPISALQNIAVINGRGALYGDAMLAVVQSHPAYEWHKEWIEGEGDSRVAYFQIKRKGQDAHTASFSVANAKAAKLWMKKGGTNGDKDTPWVTYPERMLLWRARGFGLRDKFADALKGIISAEEAMDIPDDQRTVDAEPVIQRPQRASEGVVVEQVKPEAKVEAPQAAEAQQEATDDGDVLAPKDHVDQALAAFAKVKVTTADLEEYVGWPHTQWTNSNIDDLREVYDTMKAGTAWKLIIIATREKRAAEKRAAEAKSPTPPEQVPETKAEVKADPEPGLICPVCKGTQTTFNTGTCMWDCLPCGKSFDQENAGEDTEQKIGDKERKRIFALIGEAYKALPKNSGLDRKGYEKLSRKWLKDQFGSEHTTDLTMAQFPQAVAHFEALAHPESGEKA
jgi:ribosomal protein L37AE/L43A